MWSEVTDRLLDDVRRDDAVRAVLDDLDDDVAGGSVPATVAAERVLAAFRRRAPGSAG